MRPPEPIPPPPPGWMPKSGDPETCPHDEFQSDNQVMRVKNKDTGAVEAYYQLVRTHCSKCGLQMYFAHGEQMAKLDLFVSRPACAEDMQ